MFTHDLDDRTRHTGPLETRRKFYVRAICGMCSLIAAALGVPAFLYVTSAPQSAKKDQWVEAGSVQDLPPEQPYEVSFRVNRLDGWKTVSEKQTAWVVKHPDSSLTAFGPQCTHLGCAYHWEGARKAFVCPCHNSLFGIDGKVLAGPARRPLDRYETRLEGGTLLIGQLRRSPEGVS